MPCMRLWLISCPDNRDSSFTNLFSYKKTSSNSLKSRGREAPRTAPGSQEEQLGDIDVKLGSKGILAGNLIVVVDIVADDK